MTEFRNGKLYDAEKERCLDINETARYAAKLQEIAAAGYMDQEGLVWLKEVKQYLYNLTK